MQIVVTGTDTGVGKTVVAAALAQGMGATYWKPIQCGMPTDTEWVKRNAACECLHEAYKLSQPFSPHLAAEMEGVTIQTDQLSVPGVSSLIIEGAGGVAVPINDDTLFIDLFAKWQRPTIVVARSTLGTINHTVLTVRALRERGVPLLGVVLNGPLNPENRRAIERYAAIDVIGEIEPMNSLDLKSIYRSISCPQLSGALSM
jgi:dethiobiotin synthase